MPLINLLFVLSLLLSQNVVAQVFSKEENICLTDTSESFGLNECLLKSVLIAEGGTPGAITSHNNGSEDIGRGQINRGGEWAKYLNTIGVTEDQLIKNPCVNIAATGYILKTELDRVGGQLELGVGNYHAGYSKVISKRRQEYFDRVLKIYSSLKNRNEC